MGNKSSVTDNIRQRLHQKLSINDIAGLEMLLATEHPSEVADFIAGLPTKTIEKFWMHLAPIVQGRILAYCESEVRGRIVPLMKKSQLATAIKEIDADDATDILQDLSLWVQHDVLAALTEKQRNEIQLLLNYPEDSAGGLMNYDVLKMQSSATAGEGITYLRDLGTLPKNSENIMIIDGKNTYLGVLSLADLITSDPIIKIEKLYKERIGVPATMEAKDVINLFDKYGLISAAVISNQGKLLGQITVVDVLNMLRRNIDENIAAAAGVGEIALFAPVPLSALNRGFWLGINLLTAMLASSVIGLFEETIHAITILAILMPIVASMGGVAATQTLTIVVRGLSLGHLTDRNLLELLKKECLVNMLGGGVWSTVVGIVSFLWFGNIEISLVFAVAMFSNHIVAATSGVLVPFILHNMKIDPAVAGGVLVSTFTDVAGFFIFLGLSTILLLGQ